MTDERWRELMDNERLELTKAEIAEGWHFCREWDGLLIRRDSPEFEFCVRGSNCLGVQKDD